MRTRKKKIKILSEEKRLEIINKSRTNKKTFRPNLFDEDDERNNFNNCKNCGCLTKLYPTCEYCSTFLKEES